MNTSQPVSVQRTLLTICCSDIAVSLMLVLAFELFGLTRGPLAEATTATFILTAAAELLSLCLIPLSLRLFRFRRVQAAFSANPQAALRRWGTVRLQMLTVPMMAYTLLYYLLMQVAFGYLAIIHLIALAFVWPTKRRCQAELQ